MHWSRIRSRSARFRAMHERPPSSSPRVRTNRGGSLWHGVAATPPRCRFDANPMSSMKNGIAAVMLCLSLAGPAIAQARPASVAAEGTQFVVTLDDGRVLRSPQLVGAVLTVSLDGRTVRLRVDAVETD